MDHAARFADHVARSPESVPLDAAALAIAGHVRDGAIDVPRALATLDRLAASCPALTFTDLGRHLFRHEGFHGNAARYADPANSYLDRVLERRLGIPISLAVVMMEVGRRLGVGIVGIGMPGHFLVRDARDAARFCDPFHGGQIFDVAGCAAVFRRVHGPSVTFELGMLAPTSTHALLARVLANLERGPLGRDPVACSRLLDLHVVIPGLAPAERIALSEQLRAIGRFVDAATQLELAARAAPQHAPQLRADARRVRAHLN